MSWRETIDILDPVWEAHGSRVAVLSREVGNSIGLEFDRLRRLEIASLLHDIGKSAIAPTVMLKPGELTAEEWAIVKRHPEQGFEMVDGLVHPEIAQAVLHHHENFDGSGYPFGRAGHQIPLLARVLSVVDAFDAIVSERTYQEALPADFAIDELRRHAGTQFDPGVVDALIGCVGSSALLVAGAA